MTTPLVPDLSPDQLVTWLRRTEAKLAPVKRVLGVRERSLSTLSPRHRQAQALNLAVQRALVEDTEARLALVRSELGLGPVPRDCFRTDGRGNRCDLRFGHEGLHTRLDPETELMRRWE